MTTEQGWLVITSATALVALLLSALAWRRASRAEAHVQHHVDRLAVQEAPVTSAPQAAVTGPDPTAYVITRLDAEHAAEAPAPGVAQRIEGRLFADIVARETVVRAASWTRGVRRALSPETRNRIRFQVRQETKRAGRERKAEMKVALREYRSRAAGADVTADLGEDVA